MGCVPQKREPNIYCWTDTLCKFRRGTGKCVPAYGVPEIGTIFMVQEIFARAQGGSF